VPDKFPIEKMYLREGYRALLVAEPPGYRRQLGRLPKGVVLLSSSGGQADWIQVFVRSRKDMERRLPGLRRRLAANGLLWISYAKGGSDLATDVNRDVIIAYAPSIGLQTVAQVSIDQDWSAVRLKVLG
jgi:hypothetical protein